MTTVLRNVRGHRSTSGWALLLACVICLALAPPAQADDLLDLFLGRNGRFHGRLYGGRVDGSSRDGIVKVKVRGGGRKLEFCGCGKRTFREWVDRNEDEIGDILFPGGPEGAAQGIPGGARQALDAFGRLFGTTHEAMALLDYERFRVDGLDGDTYRLTLGRNGRFDDLEIGVAVPLRYADLDDDIHTSSYAAGLDLHAKYHIPINPELEVIPVVGAGSSVFALDSDHAGAMGHIRYGGYGGVLAKVDLRPFVVAAGVLYSLSELEIPGGLFPDEAEPFADALERRPLDQHVVFGGKVAYHLGGSFLAAFGGQHLETVGSSGVAEGKQALSQIAPSIMWFPNDWLGFELGYRHLFGASRLHAHAGFLQGVLNF